MTTASLTISIWRIQPIRRPVTFFAEVVKRDRVVHETTGYATEDEAREAARVWVEKQKR